MTSGHEKRGHTLTDDVRLAALDNAAATLAAIHMAKQAYADVKATFVSTRPVVPDLRLRAGDVLFGIAQLQVDFARRLFEFNRATATALRNKLSGGLREGSKTLRATFVGARASGALLFDIRNCASLSRTFSFRASSPRGVTFDPSLITLPAGLSDKITARFQDLEPGTYAGDISVESQGLCVERIPFEIIVTP